MDPNETLRRLREAVAALRREAQWRHESAFGATVTEVLDDVEALDEWLGAGGFPPSEWSKS